MSVKYITTIESIYTGQEEIGPPEEGARLISTTLVEKEWDRDYADSIYTIAYTWVVESGNDNE